MQLMLSGRRCGSLPSSSCTSSCRTSAISYTTENLSSRRTPRSCRARSPTNCSTVAGGSGCPRSAGPESPQPPDVAPPDAVSATAILAALKRVLRADRGDLLAGRPGELGPAVDADVPELPVPLVRDDVDHDVRVRDLLVDGGLG